MQNAQLIYLETIEALIQEGELEKALNSMLELEKQTTAGLKTDLLAQSGRLKEVEKMFGRGMLPFDQYSIQKNQIRFYLTGLAQDFPKQIELNDKIKGLGGFNFKVPDETRLEKVLGGQNNLLKINWLEKALRASKAVCRVVVENGELGTGFLTKEGFIFTNNHVLKTVDDAKTARVEFNFETDLNGQVKSRTSYKLDASTYITSTPDQFDFAKVKVIDDLAKPLSQWGFVEFDPSAIPTVGESVTIIQHPKGEDKQIALNANQVYSIWNQHIFYETDTEPGSSGSPVFNKDWKVVAIHHAGSDAMKINARGDVKPANRGILFENIFDFISKNGGSVPSISSKSTGKTVHESFKSETETPADSPEISPKPAPETPKPVAPAGPPKWLILYSEEDYEVSKTLNKHLAVLKFTKKIKVFNVQSDITAAENVDERVAAEIADARMVIALITPNLLASDTWFGKLFEAVEAKKTVVPILVERSDFSGTGLEKLKSLPSLGRFISDFPNRDTAWADVVEQLKKAI